MATFAVMSGNQVGNLIAADTLADAELVTRSTCIEYTDHTTVGLNWTYDETTGQFTDPTAEVPSA